MDELITCVNGVFVPSGEAVLPVADRGMRFGDGAFETICLHRGVPYQWEKHEERLRASLAALRILWPEVDLKGFARTLVQQNKAETGSIRISVSRGVGSRGYMPLPSIAPNWVMEYIPAGAPTGAACRLWVSEQRRIPLVSLPMNVKIAQGVGSTLALLEAQDHGCDEALQLSTAGVITCAASANIGWIKGRSVFTPALSTGCLRGTTRGRLMEISPYPLHECSEELRTLETADAVFLCNSRVGVWPVEEITPLDIQYRTDHPILLELAQLIHNDRDFYFESNKLYWLGKSCAG